MGLPARGRAASLSGRAARGRAVKAANHAAAQEAQFKEMRGYKKDNPWA